MIDCDICKGAGKLAGIGFMQETCWRCSGTKQIRVDQIKIDEVVNAQQIDTAETQSKENWFGTPDNAEQNNVENSENSSGQTEVDQSKTISSKTKRQPKRTPTMGTRKQNISKSKASG
jgi:hypothetical protein